MIKHDLKDAKLTASVDIPAATSATATSDPIDIGQEGGIDECQLVIECPATGSAVTLAILSAPTENDEYAATSRTITTNGTDATTYRDRIPLDAHRYIKIQATTGSTAPTACTATISVRV